MNVLITGARAPVALAIARSMHAQGYKVFTADSMKHSLPKYSQAVEKYCFVPSPRHHPEAFIASIESLIKQHRIDLILPTCEEAFYLSQYHQRLSLHCQLLFDDIDQLIRLHNKYQFNRLASQFDIGIPKSKVLDNINSLNEMDLSHLVLKPIYSRFGDHILIKPKPHELKRIKPDKTYLAQQFIDGIEYCSYSIAIKGKILAHCLYHSKYKAGTTGIYFQPVSNPQIERFVQQLASSLNYTGQICFDFIVNQDSAYVLECNPRATSGFHLLRDSIDWNSLLAGNIQNATKPTRHAMLGMAMLLYGSKYLFSKKGLQFLRDYYSGSDIIRGHDIRWAQLRSLQSLYEIMQRMVKQKQALHIAATADIDWNGPS